MAVRAVSRHRHVELPAPPETARKAAERVLVLTSAIMSGIWGLGLAAGIQSPGSGLRSLSLAYAGLALVFIAWLASLVLRVLPPRIFVGVMVVTAIAQIANTEPITLTGPNATVVPWLTLSVVMSALLSGRRSVVVIWAQAGASLLLLLGDATVTGSLSESWRAASLLPVYAACVGMVCFGIASALRGIATEVDEATSTRLASAAEAERTRVRSEETQSVNRTLHDTVINTFGAIRAFGHVGGAESANVAALIRERAAFDLSVLSREPEPQPQPEPDAGADRTRTSRYLADLLSRVRDRSALPSPLLTVLIPTVTQVAGWFIVLFAINTVLVLGADPVAWSLVGFVMFSAVSLLAVRSARGGIPVSWRVSSALVVSAGLAAYWPIAGAVGCSRIGTGWWGSLAGTTCVVLLVLLSNRAVWIAAGAFSYVVGVIVLTVQILPEARACAADSIPLILLTDAALVVGAILFRSLLTRYGAEAEQSREAALELQANIIHTEERERIRDDRMRSVRHSVAPLLSGLADGRLSPADPSVRLRCALQETHLRSLQSIHPDLGVLGDTLGATVDEANALGASVVIRATEPCRIPPDPAIAKIAEIMGVAAGLLPEGSEAIVTQFAQPGGGAITITGPLRAGARPRLPDAGGAVRVDLEMQDEGFWIEVAWG